MEIKPLKSHKLPRYAAALAVITAAGMMTGCVTDGEIATEGTAPAPAAYATEHNVQEPAGTTVCTTAGDVAVIEDSSATEATSGVTESETQLVGLEGDVVAFEETSP